MREAPGVSGRLIAPDELDARMVKAVTVQDTSTPTVAGNWGGARALNQASGLLQANTDYALVGILCGVSCAAISIRGPDTGNLRAGVPGAALNPLNNEDWFVQLSIETGRPCIPVFNYANAGATFIEVLQNQALAAVPFSLSLIELSRS